MIHFAPAKPLVSQPEIFAKLTPDETTALSMVAKQSGFPNALQQLQSFAAVGALNLETLQQIARRGIPLDVVLRELQQKKV